jgi:hypothetical protein
VVYIENFYIELHSETYQGKNTKTLVCNEVGNRQICIIMMIAIKASFYIFNDFASSVLTLVR